MIVFFGSPDVESGWFKDGAVNPIFETSHLLMSYYDIAQLDAQPWPIKLRTWRSLIA